jgi:hypothetical protein
MDLSSLSKIKDINDRYKDCIKSALIMRKYFENLLVIVREFANGVITTINKSRPIPEFEDPTNIANNTNHFMEF